MNRFYAGSDIIFGQGSLSALPELLKEFDAKRVMVISDRGVLRRRDHGESGQTAGRGQCRDRSVQRCAAQSHK